jgi:hypothetical protein
MSKSQLIQRGSIGESTKKWQRLLIATGYLPEGKDDGNFGIRTHLASIAYQKERGLYPDGIIGKNTILAAVADGYEKPTAFEREITFIVCHITANSNNLLGNDLRNLIDAGHRTRKFRKIGYHRLIDKAGTEIIGRTDDEIGAHCEGYNTGSISISYDDRGDDHKANAPYGQFMNEAQKATFERVLKELMEKYNIPPREFTGIIN